ncbi:RNA helicase, ATP-dependent, SK12/DOB1 protein [Artemisia annua]|uniref:RNA helicase, ATP-dependent, SK12/DOB1 protein n=1 Tax=Artemisia annua TaxID=35608 RepID=A0A2U1LW30_ARTAN|nr:RNA helicase, ATP-dependent, SK12/DOB1 protein [Artemisia annua]
MEEERLWEQQELERYIKEQEWEVDEYHISHWIGDEETINRTPTSTSIYLNVNTQESVATPMVEDVVEAPDGEPVVAELNVPESIIAKPVVVEADVAEQVVADSSSSKKKEKARRNQRSLNHHSRSFTRIEADDVVELKGKVTCEISSTDELVLTKLMFNGVFKDIKIEEMVSLLSCFVWQKKLQDAQKPREELEMLFTQLQDTARRVARVQLDSKEVLMRGIRRMEEILQQLIVAAKSVGEAELETKFEDAFSKIERDIIVEL